MFNICIDYTYLSVNTVKAIGENSNFSYQLRTKFHCASAIPYHVFLICGYELEKVERLCLLRTNNFMLTALIRYSWHIDMTYYDQKVNHGHGCPAGTKNTLPHYMPMVKTFNQHTDLSVLDPHAPFILGFNEPNHKDEAHGGLTPQHAADAWRQIEQHSHGIRLVSPAMAGEDYKWLDEFFKLCNGCRIDYIAAHKYSCDANEIMGFMNRLWHRYHKKIWLTEFACPLSTSEDQQLHLMQKLLPQLEAAPFISRFVRSIHYVFFS